MESTLATVSSNKDDIDRVRSVARSYAAEIKQHFGDRLHSVHLYGSAARGDWSPESDIDVLIVLDVVSDEDTDWLVDRAVALGVLSSGFLLQPVYMTAADFAHLKQRERRFALDVEREGIRL